MDLAADSSGHRRQRVGGSETFRAPRGGNRAAAHAGKMCRILINQTMGCIGDDLTLENGDKPGGAGRKAAEQETPQKPLRGGKRAGAGSASPEMTPTTAAVAEQAGNQSLINQTLVAGGDKRGGKRRGAGRKTAEEETRRRGKPAAVPPLVPTEPPAQTPEEFLGVVMNDPANPSGHGPG